MTHQLSCDICCEVAYEFDGFCDRHDGVESTCPGCSAVGTVHVDCDEGYMSVEWRSNKGEWERIRTPEESASCP